MRKKLYVILCLFSLTYFFSNGQTPVQNQKLSAAEFQKKMLELPKAPIVDVRTPEEYNNGHLQNAINININSASFESDINKLDKNKPVFVYCLSGSRSTYASNSMRAAGFKEVYELLGGMMKWRAAGLSETKNTSTSTKEMSTAQFNEFLKTDKMVLVDFYADWCAPCKKMAPYLEEIQKEMNATVSIIRINADQNRSIAAQLKVTALPTLMLYKNKAVIWTNTGYQTKDEIKLHLVKN